VGNNKNYCECFELESLYLLVRVEKESQLQSQKWVFEEKIILCYYGDDGRISQRRDLKKTEEGEYIVVLRYEGNIKTKEYVWRNIEIYDGHAQFFNIVTLYNYVPYYGF